MQLCSRCILPENYRNIQFDAEGVCNYCRTYDQLSQRLNDFETLHHRFEQRLEKFKGKFEYDCLVGLSGGKDSSYVAMELKQRYGLKIFAVTVDNGFLTDYGRENVAKVVEALGVEHEFVMIDWDFHRTLYQQAVRWFGTPCPGCSYAGYILFHKIAFDKRIPLAIHGRSRSQMFRELLAGSPDSFIPYIKTNVSPHDRDLVLQTTLQAKKRSEVFLRMAFRDRNVRNRFYEECFPDMDRFVQSEVVPEFVGYFLYHPYDERIIMQELERRLSWTPPPNREILTHQDCAVHDAAAYLFYQVFGYSLLTFELSVLIREGSLARDEALRRLDLEPGITDVPEESLAILCERLAIDPRDLPGIIRKARRGHLWKKRILGWKNRIVRPRLDL